MEEEDSKVGESRSLTSFPSHPPFRTRRLLNLLPFPSYHLLLHREPEGHYLWVQVYEITSNV